MEKWGVVVEKWGVVVVEKWGVVCVEGVLAVVSGI